MPQKIRVVHYLNQFFAQVGGEDKAGIGPGTKEGPVGPGRPLGDALGSRGEIVGTLYCGDNYFVEREAEAIQKLLELLESYRPELLVAGPAFESGRYGIACGALCQAAQSRLRIPAVTAMDEGNAGALHRKTVYIVNSGSSVT